MSCCDSPHVIFMNGNHFLHYGLEALLKWTIHSCHESAFFAAAKGILLLAPEGCSAAHRLEMLHAAHRLRIMPGWRGLVFVDRRNAAAVRFARLTGLPDVDLCSSPDEICRAVLTEARRAEKTVAGSVSMLTRGQWSALHDSLSEGYARKTRHKSFYTLRSIALDRIGLKNIHELRIIMSK